jgi:hypothetical protein
MYSVNGSGRERGLPTNIQRRLPGYNWHFSQLHMRSEQAACDRPAQIDDIRALIGVDGGLGQLGAPTIFLAWRVGAERRFCLRPQLVLSVPVAGREVKGDEAVDTRSLCDIAGLACC